MTGARSITKDGRARARSGERVLSDGRSRCVPMNRAYTVTRAVALLAVVVASFVDMSAQGRALPGGGSPATLTIDQAVREAVDHNLTLLPERFNVKRRGRRPDQDRKSTRLNSSHL